MRLPYTIPLTLLSGLLAGPVCAAPGGLDPAFGGVGYVTTPLGPGSANCIAVQSDGKICLQRDGKMLAARNSFVGSYDFALVRYHSDGPLDTSFGGDGIVNLPAGPGAHICFGAAIQPDGKILAAGHFNNESFALVRYLADGNCDTSFGGTGVVNTTIGDRSSGFCMALQNDGKVLVAGSSLSGTCRFSRPARHCGNPRALN